MALVLKDRVRETATVLGTADATLLGAVTGYQSFSVIGNTNTCYYTIADNSGNWEVGLGTYSSVGPTLARTTVIASSNSGNKVNFPAGTKDIFVTYPAEYAAYVDGSNIVPGTAATVPTTYGGTGLSSYTSGDITYYSAGTALSKLSIGTNGQLLKSNGTSPSWADATTLAVTSISFGTTGLTPSTATQGAVTVAGTLATANGGTGLTTFNANGALYATSSSALTTGTLPTTSGGTGLSSYSAGDIVYYATGTALSKLTIGTNGYVLKSNGTAPVWENAANVSVTTFSGGTTGLTPSTPTGGSVTLGGTLALANGGTGATTVSAAQTNLQVDPAGTAVAMAIALGG